MFLASRAQVHPMRLNADLIILILVMAYWSNCF
jgi:hypothetical protein